MRFTASYAIFLRYWYLLTGTPQRFVQIFIWSTLDILLWGFVTKYLGMLDMQGVNFTTILLGSLIFWQFITRIQQGYIMVFLEDSWSRNFFNFFASPLSIGEYVLGIVAASMTTSAMAIVFGACVAALVFGLVLPPVLLPFTVFAIILALFAVTLGIISTTILLRYGPSAEWYAWPVPAIIQPLVGVFYPIAVLPGWAQAIASALPPTYVFENLRAILMGGSVDWNQLLFALVLSVGYMVVAGWLFARMYRWALRTGAISRFGSESF